LKIFSNQKGNKKTEKTLTLLKFCEHTVYVTQLHKKSTSQSLLANYCMRPLLGGGLHQQLTGSVLKQYFAVACVLVCTHHSKLLTE